MAGSRKGAWLVVGAFMLGACAAPAADARTSSAVPASRQMEDLGRGVVAVNMGGGKVYIGWRLLGTEPNTIAFNVYRGGTKINARAISSSTNYVDDKGDPDAVYAVRPVIDGNETEPAGTARVWSQNYLSIPLQTPTGYTPNDASVGDLDGDGEYEIVLHQTGVSRDNASSGLTDEPILQAYKLDGTFLWSINLGKNIREGAHYTQFMVYDLDGDGRAEVACKTADGTIDGRGHVIGDPNADWRQSNGYILTGPEYLTVFDGETGAALATTDFYPDRVAVNQWGDTYGNRVDRFLAAIAYVDGQRPSLIMARGYYGPQSGKTMARNEIVAYNWREGLITRLWWFKADVGIRNINKEYVGQGNHSLAVGDVDSDGRDEIIYGACAIDHDGTGLYSTRLGHGDAMHFSDLDPDRPGLEVFDVHESASAAGAEFRDAATGQLIWGVATSRDNGRGMTGDIDLRFRGYESWSAANAGLYNCKGVQIWPGKPRSCNFKVWWDDDLLCELLDSNYINKWNWTNGSETRLLTATGCTSNNGTKSTPCLCADILGDWREEVIWRTTDNKELRIFTTTIATDHRIYTLMHDPIYRLSVAWQNVAYNQPPHTGFYLGDGMAAPPRPGIELVSRAR